MRKIETEHCAFVRALPCCICGDDTSTECAHIRYGDQRVSKPQTGIGIRPDDCWTVPLCNKHHTEQHKSGERQWWFKIGKDPIFIAMALHRVSGDHAAGCRIVEANRP